MEETIQIAKKIITKEVEKAGFNIIKVIVFGSRVKGNYTEESDWDFFVVLNEDITFKELKKLTGKIKMQLAHYKIPNHIILRGINQFEKSKMTVGNISYYVAREGVGM